MLIKIIILLYLNTKGMENFYLKLTGTVLLSLLNIHIYIKYSYVN